jgi:hypothetical protein
MTISDPESEKNEVKEGMPVMPCQTTEDGAVNGQLVRGSTPSTPDGLRRKRKESRRMSVLKFFRCTPEQDAVIKTNAANAGMEEASYMRSQAIGVPVMRKIRRIRADWKELQRCMGIINKAGNVVNQLVKVLYLGGVRSDIADGALVELRKAAQAVMAALGKE